MKNFLSVFVSVVYINLGFQPLLVFSTPNYYTGTTTLWSNGGSNGHLMKNQGVPVPAVYLVKTLSDIDTAGVCKEKNGQFADPKFCNKYYDCWDGRPVSKRCYNGLMFNENISSCDFPNNVDCSGKDVDQPIEKDKGCEQAYGKFPDSRDCRKYVVCHAGKAAYFTCEEGLAYDKDNQHCATPSNPICLQGPPNDIPEGQDFPEIPLDPDTIQPAPPSGPSGGGDGDVVFPITPDWPQGTKCPTSSSGFFPVAKDCKSVIVCIKGSGYMLTCPFGTYYHAAQASCRPGKSDSCEQMRFTLVNTKGSTDEKFGYLKQGYPLLPLYTW